MSKETISMKEAVARAIYDSLLNETPPGEYVQDDSDDTRSVCLDGYFDLGQLATAAIKAMREPSPAMVDKAWSLITSNLRYEEAYRHMVDAALSQE